MNIRSLLSLHLFIVLTVSSTLVAKAQKIEAESGSLSGTNIGTSRGGYSGNGYVTGFDNDNDQVTIDVNADESGLFQLEVSYAADQYKENFILVNDQSVGSMKFQPSSSFTSGSFGKIFLNKGSNTITVRKSWGYTDIDYIKISPASPSDYHNIANELVTPDPSDKVKKLYDYLGDIYGKKILSGQQGSDLSNINYIAEKTGKYPAVRGFDFIDYSPSRVDHGANSNETEDMLDWHDEGGIITACWHWNAPKDLIDQPGQEWWRGFYTDATTFDISIAMNNQSSEEYNLIIRDIDAIAEQLKILQEADIPIIFRPLHEAEGGWFWWGAKGPEPCKWLWELMFDRLVNDHGINNLIWVWTSTDADDALDWYPGDDYVDIIGADIYLAAGNYTTSFSMFDNLVSMYNGAKIITLSETGTIPDAGDLDQQFARWNWFCTWEGDFIKDGTYNSVSHLNEVYNHEYVITLDELPDLANYIALPDEPDDPDETITGLDENYDKNISYSPNPVSENLNVSFTDPSNINSVALIDIQGRQLLLLNNVKNRSEINIDFKGLREGIYLLKIIEKGQVKTYKLLKKEIL